MRNLPTNTAASCQRRTSAEWLTGILRLVGFALLFACLLVALPACGGAEDSTDQAIAAPAKSKKDTSKGSSSSKSSSSGKGKTSKATGAAYTMPSEARIPELPSLVGVSVIDTSGIDDGYIGVAARSSSRLKFQVKCGEMTYNYDLPNDGTPTLYPINMGDGSYAFRIMENIEGSSYAELDAAYADVELSSEFDPFLIPNIFCSYDAKSDCVARARKVAGDATNEGEVVRDICTYVATTVSYDHDKAKVLAQSSGYIPDPDATLSDKTGVCFDFASLTAAMLRSLGMPTKVVTGYVSPKDLYHAWIMVYADGTWQTAQFSVSPKTWSRCDVTFASAGPGSTVGNGTTYTDRYIY